MFESDIQTFEFAITSSSVSDMWFGQLLVDYRDTFDFATKSPNTGDTVLHLATSKAVAWDENGVLACTLVYMCMLLLCLKTMLQTPVKLLHTPLRYV